MNPLDKLNKAYAEGKSIVSDREWDKFITDMNIPDVWEVQGNIPHKYFMGRMKKTHDYNYFVNLKSFGYQYEPKWDGISCELTYVEGKLIRAVTRGNGRFGFDITRHFNKTGNALYNDGTGIIRGELVISYENFEKNFSDYKHPRNAVAGLFNPKTQELSDRLKYVAFLYYDTVEEFELKPYIPTIADYEDINQILLKGSFLGYPIDGVVAKLVGRPHFGEDGKREDCVAYKLEVSTDTALSYVKQIDWQVSRLGKLTPVGIINPVKIEGVTVRRVTLNSAGSVESNHAHPGCIVRMQRGGGVIPKAIEVIDNKDYKDIVLPTECPSCGNYLVRVGAHLFCLNEVCADRFKSYLEYAVKDVLDIKNWGRESIFDAFIQYYNAAFKLELKIKLDAVVQKFLISIYQDESISFNQLLLLCNIPDLGKTQAAKIAKSFETVEDLLVYLRGNETYGKIFGSEDNRQFIASKHRRIALCGDVWRTFSVIRYLATPEISVVVTGVFPMARSLLIDKLRAEKVEVKSSVTKEVSQVLVGTAPGKSKIEKAEKYGIPVIKVDTIELLSEWLTGRGIDPDKFCSEGSFKSEMIDI